MNKRILLGLLLVPCAAHAMEQERLEMRDDNTLTKYTYANRKGSTQAIYLKDSKEYIIERSSWHTVSRLDCDNGNPTYTFAALKAAYEQQQKENAAEGDNR